jgi:hypothetical protein
MVLTEAKAKLQVLQPIAARMNEVSDVLRDEIKEVEEGLAKLSLGIEATYFQPFDESQPATEIVWANAYDVETGDRLEQPVQTEVVVKYVNHLSYRKHKGSWRLVVVTSRCRREEVAVEKHEWDPVEEKVVPLLEAPRQLRIAAAEFIPELIDQLRHDAERGIAALSKVADKISK